MIINIKFNETKQKIDAKFTDNSEHFKANFGEFVTITKYVGGEAFEGDYTVIPKISPQIMPTKEKVMINDVTIKAIPYYETSNLSNGKTIIIGGTLNE